MLDTTMSWYFLMTMLLVTAFCLIMGYSNTWYSVMCVLGNFVASPFGYLLFTGLTMYNVVRLWDYKYTVFLSLANFMIVSYISYIVRKPTRNEKTKESSKYKVLVDPRTGKKVSSDAPIEFINEVKMYISKYGMKSPEDLPQPVEYNEDDFAEYGVYSDNYA